MNVVVDLIPNTCRDCLFLGTLVDGTLDKHCITYTGCTLLKLKLSREIAFKTRLNNCPLIEQSIKIKS